MAIEVERRLDEKRRLKAVMDNSSDDNIDSGRTVIDAIATLERSPSNYDTSAAIESLIEDSANLNLHENTIKDDDATPLIDSKQSKVSLSLNTDVITADDKRNFLSPYSLHSSPSLGALDEDKNQSLYFTPMSTQENVPSNPNSGRLIRSNSFIVEKPSPMLLQHMKANGIAIAVPSKESERKSEFSISKQQENSISYSTPTKPIRTKSSTSLCSNSSKEARLKSNSTINANARSVLPPIRKTASDSKVTSKTTKTLPTKQKQHENGNGIFKNKPSVLQSIYNPSSYLINSNSKTNVKQISNKVTRQSQRPAENNKSKTKSSPSRKSPKDYEEILRMIKTQHEAQVRELIKRQQEEQTRMQLEFKRQQDSLLMRISRIMANSNNKSNKSSLLNESLLSNGTNSSPSETNGNWDTTSETDSVIPTNIDSNGNRINRFTPESAKCIRRLNYDDHHAQIVPTLNLMQTPVSSSDEQSIAQTSMYTQTEIKAATIIAAYVRGYLTRKLFQTSKVQTIVKTIRDTLTFVLDLHFEHNPNESESDIELKTMLIQQVNAYSSLHYKCQTHTRFAPFSNTHFFFSIFTLFLVVLFRFYCQIFQNQNKFSFLRFSVSELSISVDIVQL